ncbi:hypothetical protein QCA50_013181 [Cerrena zonata]|uniref:Purine-cytosine permease n=1 Tax=Cerrena zonata TaxID=2478898 RepID=A0AAW0FR72_9APHY
MTPTLADEKSSSFVTDEKALETEVSEEPIVEADKTSLLDKVTQWLSRWGVETQGITPTSEEERTDKRMYQMFFVWFAANVNILTFGAGSVGPAVFGLGQRTSCLTILVVDLIACAFPAFFAVFGPKLGTRAMVQSRFSWGYYGAIIPSILNVVSMEGYLVINCIVGGQALASLSDHLSAALGIVIIGLISCAVTFCGYKVLHWYELLVWVPNVIAFVVMLGVGGKQLTQTPVTDAVPASAGSILTFGAALAVTVIAWSTITPDNGVYHDCRASAFRTFIYAYLGLFVASFPVHIIGAAFTAAAPYVTTWQEGLGNGNDVGGLVGAILAPAGGFGKFLLVLLALSTPSACAPTLYTVCTSFMTISTVFAKIPRSIIAVVSTAILIPVAIVGATHFYATFVQILSFIGYWLAPFTAIVITEHILFRKMKWANYDVLRCWNKPALLPSCLPALITFAITIGVVVLCMEQEWWTGPVAKAGTGDIAMIVGFIVASGTFALLRSLELHLRSRKTDVSI